MSDSKKPILVLGTLGYNTNKLDGQTVKTRNIVTLLNQKYVGQINVIDTLVAKKNIIKTIIQLLINLVRCKIVIIIPASHSFDVILPHIYRLSKVLRYEIILLCVGGWQIEFFNGSSKYKPHPNHLKICRRIKAFMPEIDKVTNELTDKYGFKNCETFPNFRLTEQLPATKNGHNEQDPLKLVFMARVNKLKGYDLIFTFAETIQKQNLNIKIDFYGPINEDDKTDFLSKVQSYCDITAYRGVLQPEIINTTLAKYDLLLLPTRYYTEGVPGTILDAYAAQVPVIVTNWKHAKEVVVDGVSGIIIDFENPQKEFNETILRLYNNRNLLDQLKQGTYIGLKPYSAETAWNRLKKYL